MSIRFILTFEDLASLQQNVIKHAYTHRIKKQYYKWISAIVLFVVAILIMKASVVTSLISLIITICYLIIFPFLYAKITFLNLRNKMQKNDYSHVLGACVMTLSEDGIDRELNNTTTHFAWDRFEKWHENSHHYFLYVSDLQGLIIPKQPDGMDDEENDTYNDFVKKKLDIKITSP